MNEENMGVIQEIAVPDETHTLSEADVPVSNAAPVEDAQTKNWKEIRKALKELQKENQYLRNHLETQQAKPQEDPDENEPYVTPKRLDSKLSELERRLQQKEAETVEDRMRSKYADFDQVVSSENVEYLKQYDPELALSIQLLANDPMKQALAAYKVLKKTDYHQNRQIAADKTKMEENSKRPVSVQAVRKQGVLAEANRFSMGLTPDLKKSLLNEMMQARKGA